MPHIAVVVKKRMRNCYDTAKVESIIRGSRFTPEDVAHGGLLHNRTADWVWDLPPAKGEEARRSSEYDRQVLAHALLCAEVFALIVVEGSVADAGGTKSPLYVAGYLDEVRQLYTARG